MFVGTVFAPYFAMQYLVFFLVLQSSRRGCELVALLCVLAVVGWYVIVTFPAKLTCFSIKSFKHGLSII